MHMMYIHYQKVFPIHTSTTNGKPNKAFKVLYEYYKWGNYANLMHRPC